MGLQEYKEITRPVRFDRRNEIRDRWQLDVDREGRKEHDRIGSARMPKVRLLDYAADNIRSLVNAIEKCGYELSGFGGWRMLRALM
jgi:hypothetical protein